jgi:hypothetical protein
VQIETSQGVQPHQDATIQQLAEHPFPDPLHEARHQSLSRDRRESERQTTTDIR